VFGSPPGPSTPPGAPGQPTASNITSNSVTLTWTAATPGTNPIAGYDVYRVGTPDTVVASTTGALTAAVTGLSPNTAYTFYVRARDTTNVSGSASPNRAVTTANSTPPTAPGTPVASALTPTGVTLTWTASTAGTFPVAGYEVHRVQGTTDTVVANPTTTTAAITGLTPNTAYSFYVRARDTANVLSAPSASTPVTTPPQPSTNCTVTYRIVDQWGSGFKAELTITNNGTTTINGWTLAFAFANGQSGVAGWGATWSQTGANVTATNLSWNSTIAPSATLSGLGFTANRNATNNPPTAFTLNGAACTVA
jgi:cellulase/cellobiase CelA1